MAGPEPDRDDSPSPLRRAPQSIVIRRTTGDDYFGIVAEFRYRMFADIDPGVDHSAEKEEYLRKVVDYFRRHAADPGQILVFAFDEDRGEIPVGCAAMIVTERPPRLGGPRSNSAYIHNVYVLPEYRKRGIARALMEFLHREAETMNVRRMGLHASPFGAPLYSSMGYAKGGRYMEMEIGKPERR